VEKLAQASSIATPVADRTDSNINEDQQRGGSTDSGLDPIQLLLRRTVGSAEHLERISHRLLLIGSSVELAPTGH